MANNYQKDKCEKSAPAVPERVSVALGELIGEVREGLLALAVGAGLQVLTAMMEADVIAACGPKGRHDPARTATRHGESGRSPSDCAAAQDARQRRVRGVGGADL